MLDCMAVTMVTYPSVFASFTGWVPPQQGTGRTIEVPSVEPTSDGYAVFTTNSAQQFQDFLVMIGRPDLLDDPDLAQAAKRFARRDEFLAAVHEYTTQRTTAEVLEEASLFRIPAGPVLDGSTVPDFEQFVERGVFQSSPSGRFRPAPGALLGSRGRRHGPFGPAPGNGEHTGAVTWARRPTGAETTGRRRAGVSRSRACGSSTAPPGGQVRPPPTSWPALGADVIKVESVGRPDHMRYASARRPTEDRWWEWGPLFHGVNVGKRAVTLDLTLPRASARSSSWCGRPTCWSRTTPRGSWSSSGWAGTGSTRSTPS